MNVLLSRWQFGITITYHFLRAAAQDRVGFEHPGVDHLAGEQRRAVPVQGGVRAEFGELGPDPLCSPVGCPLATSFVAGARWAPIPHGPITVVTSANLTNRAMETNLECGILIRGGPQPRAIRDHITGLQAHGYLERSK